MTMQEMIDRKMTKEEMIEQKMAEQKDHYDFICHHLGHVMLQWGEAVCNLEICISIVEGENPCCSKNQSDLVLLLDSAKIKRFITGYTKNQKYHGVLSVKEIENLLHAGIKSRDYFSHRLFIFHDGTTKARPKNNSEKNSEAKFIAVTPDVIEKETENINESLRFLKEFISKTEYKPPTNDKQEGPRRAHICKNLGNVMLLWANVVYNLENCICIMEGKNPCYLENRSNLVDLSDKEKIERFVTGYTENQKYHGVLSDQAIKNLLHAGLNSRNYFSHHLFIFQDGDIKARPKKGDTKHPKEKFIAVAPDVLDKETKNISKSFEFITEFIDKTEYGIPALIDKCASKTSD